MPGRTPGLRLRDPGATRQCIRVPWCLRALTDASTASHGTSQASVQSSFTPITQTFDTSTPTPSPIGPDMLSVGQTEDVILVDTCTADVRVGPLTAGDNRDNGGMPCTGSQAQSQLP